MSTPSGIARCHFLAEGIEFVYGSMKESLAISDFNRMRDITLTSPIVAGSSGERLNKLMNTWKGAVYPEAKIDDIKRLKGYQEQFKKYETMKISIIG